jgi:hypothetical protein
MLPIMGLLDESITFSEIAGKKDVQSGLLDDG